MSRTRIEIQKDVNACRASVEDGDTSLNDPIWKDHYLTIKQERDKAASELIGFERELADAKARGEKGRSLDEIRKELSEAETIENNMRYNLNNAQRYSQGWGLLYQQVGFFQCKANVLKKELEETIKEQEQEEKAEIEKIKKGYEQEIRSNPNNAEVYTRRGFDFIARGTANGVIQSYLNQAIEDFTQAIKIDPNAKDAYLNRAELYSQIQNFNNAIPDYNQVIRMDPDNAEAYTFRGVAYSQTKNEDKAIADYNEAIRLNPKINNAHFFRGLFYLDMAESNKENADYDKAASCLDKAIADIEEELKIQPDNNAAADVLKNAKTKKEVVAGLIRERQERYDGIVQKMNNAPTENEYQDFVQQLTAMRGFKDTAELANKCDKRYQELKKEREVREAEENQKQKAIERKKSVILFFAKIILPVVIVLLALFSGNDDIIGMAVTSFILFLLLLLIPRGLDGFLRIFSFLRLLSLIIVGIICIYVVFGNFRPVPIAIAIICSLLFLGNSIWVYIKPLFDAE